MRALRALIVVIGLMICLFCIGCGDDSNDQDLPCTQVCDTIESQCHHDNPDCEANCASYSAARKNCIVNAASCILASECK